MQDDDPHPKQGSVRIGRVELIPQAA